MLSVWVCGELPILMMSLRSAPEIQRVMMNKLAFFFPTINTGIGFGKMLICRKYEFNEVAIEKVYVAKYNGMHFKCCSNEHFKNDC